MAPTVHIVKHSDTNSFRKCPVKCRKLNVRIRNLADYFSVISSTLKGAEPFWFRGHARVEWDLVPSALRYRSKTDREKALDLIADFKRIAEIKLSRPPHPHEELMWVQIARHYGLPTRLLDWTESATAALFFTCEDAEHDGILFVLKPIDLNRLSYPKKPRVLDANLDGESIKKYLGLGARHNPSGSNPIAINPVWNSERLMLQRGTFTLHGSRFNLSGDQVSSLVGIPIFKESKPRLLEELERVGVDEMTLFPELEHSCRHLKRRTGLESWE